MVVIGADGAHVGTVDEVEGGRIRLTKKDSGECSHNVIITSSITPVIAGVEGDEFLLFAGDAEVTMEEEK